LPLHLEHTLIANRVEQAGCGTTLPPGLDAAGIEAFVRAAIGNAAMRAAASEAARETETFTPAAARDRVRGTRRRAAAILRWRASSSRGEHGTAFGHALSCASLARALEMNGHTPAFVFRELAVARGPE
jgi:UDP:flavonoid glycosyltransferase YjiC (YdhE family)